MSLFHLNVRQRLEPYPARRPSARFLDGVVYAVGVLGPLATIPQIMKIYGSHDANGISIATWGIYALFDIPWIIYGIVHAEKPLVISYTLWFCFNALVAAGAFMYGAGPGAF